MIKGTEKFKVD